MALSRIWSGFIIVAIVVAAIKCFFSDKRKFLAGWWLAKPMTPQI